MSYQPAGFPPAPYPPAGATLVGEPENQAHTVIAWIVCVLTAFYMLPWAIAATRHTRNAAPIALLNFFLGWTGAGWIGALIWACVDKHKNAHLQLPVVVAPVMLAPPYAYPQPPSAPTFPQYQPGAHAALPPGPSDPYADTQVDATVLRPNYR